MLAERRRRGKMSPMQLSKLWIKMRAAKYSLTPGQLISMYNHQEGRCAICGTFKSFNGYDSLHVDHSHETGKVRKLLCRQCNQGLGRFFDNPELMDKAAAYLRQHRVVNP
jgi:hypothetical protein